MVGGGEGARRRRRVAALPIEAEVTAGMDGDVVVRPEGRDGGKRVVVDEHRLRPVGGRGRRGRDDEGDRFPGEADAVPRQGRARRGRRVRAVAVGDRVQRGRDRRQDAVQVGRHEHRDHARHLAGLRRVDRHQSGMRHG